MQVKNNETWLLLDSSGFGGIETHILQLAQALKSQDCPVKVVFYASYGEHPLHSKLDDAGIPYLTLDGTLSALHQAMARKPFLLHTHGYKAGIIGRIFAVVHRIPVVSTFHSGDPGSGRLRLYNVIDSLTSVLGKAIAVSPHIQKRLPGPSHLINNFVSLPNLSGKKEAASIAFVGRLSHEKGPDLFCRLAATLPNAKFIVYGDGPMRQQLEKTYSHCVEFVGQVNNMEDHWADIGLLCMTSRHEGLPYAALEAMAHGIPVAAFDVGNLAELIKHEKVGWIAPNGDLDTLGKFVKLWISMGLSEREKLSKGARLKVAREYSSDAVIQKILQVYRKAIKGKESLIKQTTMERKSC